VLTFAITEYFLSQWHWLLLIFTLCVAFAFEMVNGFHDTANAVATVIYTKSLKPWSAVVLSGVANFLGIMLGGTAVAFAMVQLLPIDVLVATGTSVGVIMIVSILIASFSWNLLTWYLGIPASSSHALIGSILGVGLASTWLTGRSIYGLNWAAAQKVGLALLISPFFGFAFAFLAYLLFKLAVKKPDFFQPAKPDQTPPWWTRAILILTCTGVSYSHGSNDGQKGIGMVMLVLIAMLPLHYSLDLDATHKELHTFRESGRALNQLVQDIAPDALMTTDNISPFVLSDFQMGFSPRPDSGHPGTVVDVRPSHGLLTDRIHLVLSRVEGKNAFAEVDPVERWRLRTDILRVRKSIQALIADNSSKITAGQRTALRENLTTFSSATEYAPDWVVLAVAIALGMGTMVGWKRIVVTVGEKIGKTHLSYAQGASAELVAAITIGMASVWGMPVSTTHILSSGVAGTMVASKSGVQIKTLRNILLAWLLTLPAAMAISASLFIIGTTAVGADLGNLKPLLDESQMSHPEATSYPLHHPAPDPIPSPQTPTE
jgi:inorganic phosphate transporter, PiT family